MWILLDAAFSLLCRPRLHMRLVCPLTSYRISALQFATVVQHGNALLCWRGDFAVPDQIPASHVEWEGDKACRGSSSPGAGAGVRSSRLPVPHRVASQRRLDPWSVGRHRDSSRAVRQDRRRDALAADVRVVYQRRLHEVDPLGDGTETSLPGRQLLGRVSRVGAGRRRRYAVTYQNGVSSCTAEADHVAHSPQVFNPDRQQPPVRRA